MADDLSAPRYKALFPYLVGARGPSWLRKITVDHPVLAHVHVECPDGSYSKLKIYIVGLISESYEYIQGIIRNNALHDLILITECPWLRGYGGFLYWIFCRSYEISISPVKEFS